ncbi:helix-turn-helix domain-containing protein [Salinarimonas soli]|uniref:Helix-turn-helix transcriptional regulator n=1 Tax=Salinarimonas soli TaxID=1638099 RepID=A0A5B2VIB9_9HYPH|nr:AraC family transcriptional regulator [Salinarimonas soli]KAA2238250.1 helix-turn-helix transcriptional regulator [Salinarimonas soli]
MTVNVQPASLWTGQPLTPQPSPGGDASERTIPGLARIRRARGPAGPHALPASPEPTLLLTRGRLAQGTMRSGGAARPFTLAPGQVLVLPPGPAAEMRLDQEHDLLVLTIDPAGPAGASPLTGDLDGLGLGARTSPLITALCESLWAERDDTPDGGFDRSRVATLRHELARLSRAAPARSTGGLAPWALRRVMAHIDASVSDALTLDELAGVARLSTYHFARAFKASTGLPPHRWIQMRRIERAKELLAGRGMRVVDVAAAVGYENPSRFAKLFHRETGLSPRAFGRRSEPAAARSAS